MTRLTNWLVAAALGLGLAACVPEFENPLTDGAPADSALLGTWSAKSETDTEAMILDIAPGGEGVSVVLRDPKGSGEKLAFSGRTAEVNGVHYISLTPDDSEALGAGDAKVGYLLFRYQADGETYKVWALDPVAVGKAIESGKLKGTVTGSGSDTTPKVSASADEVAAFLSTDEGQAAFKSADASDVLILTRTTP